MLVVVLSVGVAACRPGVASAVDPACRTPPSPSDVVQQEPWQQTWFDAPAKIWPFSTGAGMTVAVIDTGVDGASQPQLERKVLPGYDFLRNVNQGDVDCAPHGTAEAGIIAAARENGIGFYGLAPDAKILPVRITEQQAVDNSSQAVDPARLADGINYAVDQGAEVIDCAVVSYRNDPAVAAAVRRAVAKGIVIVAMVGDSHSNDRDGSTGPTTPSLTPYPAEYPGVIGVGAVDSNGDRVDSSQIGTYTDLVAPGSDVEADAIGGQSSYDGTSIASAFVAASAALLLAEQPSRLGRVSGAATVQTVTQRLLSTASPELSNEQSMSYGAGLVDPYRALTESDSDKGPALLPAHTAPPPPKPNPVKEAAARARGHANHLAVRLAEAVGAGIVLLIAVALVAPLGRARRWRAGRAGRAANSPSMKGDDVPEFVPGEALFEEPHGRQ